MPGTKLNSWKTVSGVTMIAFGLAIMVIAGVENPSKEKSEAQLAIMDADMDYALAAGGDVGSIYSNAKFGGALLIKNIKAASWNSRLNIEYRRNLMERGWVVFPENVKNEVLLCKNGMMARIDSSPSMDSSHGVPQSIYGFSMSYSVNTIRTCRS